MSRKRYTEGELLAIMFGLRSRGYTLEQIAEIMKLSPGYARELWDCLKPTR